MTLWATTGFNGGAGGDWGQRMSDDYVLSAANTPSSQAVILAHEMGHVRMRGKGVRECSRMCVNEEVVGRGYDCVCVLWMHSSRPRAILGKAIEDERSACIRDVLMASRLLFMCSVRIDRREC